jgi:hypothetical protein
MGFIFTTYLSTNVILRQQQISRGNSTQQAQNHCKNSLSGCSSRRQNAFLIIHWAFSIKDPVDPAYSRPPGWIPGAAKVPMKSLNLAGAGCQIPGSCIVKFKPSSRLHPCNQIWFAEKQSTWLSAHIFLVKLHVWWEQTTTHPVLFPSIFRMVQLLQVFNPSENCTFVIGQHYPVSMVATCE